MIKLHTTSKLIINSSKLPDSVAVGWSGGADSTALLLTLLQHGYQVQAWHVDHAWHDDSALQAEQLQRQAAAWQIDIKVARLAAPNSNNREAEARQGRYAQFKQWAASSHIDTLCLGHHADDQAETVCMRLLQGAGIPGCRGMQSHRQHGSLTIVRPLLQLPQSALKRWLTEAGINWLEDPSNQDTTIWRNRIRHRLFPAMQQTGINPTQLFLRWQVQAERLTSQLDSQIDTLVHEHLCISPAAAGLSISWSVWRACSAPVRARLLQKMMAILLGEGATPGRRHILMIEAWTQRNGLGGLDLSRCRLQRKRKHLHLRPALADLTA
ncbi:MAG: tRNA lysidine(34) synthetase TilS [Mariprofundus sp.]|nr:tRNA lysidine(34) synthetase TilS [Mariprofundus sp.]